MLLLEPNTSTWPSLPLDRHLPEPMLISKEKRVFHSRNQSQAEQNLRTKGATPKLGNIYGLMLEDMVVYLCCAGIRGMKSGGDSFDPPSFASKKITKVNPFAGF